MSRCFYCFRENAEKYEIQQTTKVSGEDYSFTAKVCELCMPVGKYLLKEYKLIVKEGESNNARQQSAE